MCRMLHRAGVGVVLFVILLSGCSVSNEILVSAAISLKDCFEEIGALYENETGVKVRFNLGASGLLQKQIESGAPVDVFASAAERQMNELQSRGFILTETRRNFARNALVLVIASSSELGINGFADLIRPEITRVSIGNPKTVPAGTYARQALTNLQLWDRLQSRLVLAENVRQVLDYVARGETDAGVVYASDVVSASGEGIAVAAYASGDLHDPILYPIAVVKETKARDNARKFVDLTLSPAGQSILKKHGFLSAN